MAPTANSVKYLALGSSPPRSSLEPCSITLLDRCQGTDRGYILCSYIRPNAREPSDATLMHHGGAAPAGVATLHAILDFWRLLADESEGECLPLLRTSAVSLVPQEPAWQHSGPLGSRPRPPEPAFSIPSVGLSPWSYRPKVRRRGTSLSGS